MRLHKLESSYISLYAIKKASMQLHELAWSYIKLACSYISLHAVTQACMELHKLAFSYMSLHSVEWACMQFHELACSFMSLNAVQWAYMKFRELACSFMSLYAVPFFVWAAHKNFAVLVFTLTQIEACSWLYFHPVNLGGCDYCQDCCSKVNVSCLRIWGL